MHGIGEFAVIFVSFLLAVFLPMGLLCWQIDRFNASAGSRAFWRCVAVPFGFLAWLLLQKVLVEGHWIPRSIYGVGLLLIGWSWSLYLAGFGFVFGFLSRVRSEALAKAMSGSGDEITEKQESTKWYRWENMGPASIIIFFFLYALFNRYIPMSSEVRTYIHSIVR